MIQKPQHVSNMEAGLTERMNKNVIVCHSLIFISSVDVPLDFRHSHPVPKSSVGSIPYLISAIVSQYFASLIPL